MLKFPSLNQAIRAYTIKVIIQLDVLMTENVTSLFQFAHVFCAQSADYESSASGRKLIIDHVKLDHNEVKSKAIVLQYVVTSALNLLTRYNQQTTISSLEI
jgi:hypothetical protein